MVAFFGCLCGLLCLYWPDHNLFNEKIHFSPQKCVCLTVALRLFLHPFEFSCFCSKQNGLIVFHSNDYSYGMIDS